MPLAAPPIQRARVRANNLPDMAPDSSLHSLRASLRSAAVDLERARRRCSLLLQEYSAMPDRTAERLTLHLRARLDGLTRQADESLLVLEQLSAVVGVPFCSRGETDLLPPQHPQKAHFRDQAVTAFR